MLYVNRKQKSAITPEIIEAVLSSAGLPDAIYKRADLSYTNDVVKVHAGASEYYLKFFTDQWCDRESGTRELAAANLIRSVGISTPKVAVFGYADEKSPRNWVLLAPVPGEPLRTQLPGKLSEDVLDQSLVLLDKMATLTGTYGFVQHDPAVHRTYPTNFDFINDTVWYALHKVNDFGYDTYDLADLFGECRKFDAKPPYSLCHNDFTPKHIMIQNERITGLLDFEWSIYTDRLSDAALWLTSLSEYGAHEKNLTKVMEYARQLPRAEALHYHVASKLILAAAWPHKNIRQPYYSQTCLQKARNILRKGEVELEDVIWTEGLGVIEGDDGTQ